MWPIKRADGEWELTKLHKDDWRHMFAGIQVGQRFAEHPDDPGKFITLAVSSLELTVADASVLIERLFAFGSRREVRWTDPKEVAMTRAYEHEAGVA